jgi:hypothetical protein
MVSVSPVLVWRKIIVPERLEPVLLLEAATDTWLSSPFPDAGETVIHEGLEEIDQGLGETIGYVVHTTNALMLPPLA